MKEMMKKAAALAAAALMIFSVSVNVYAETTPRPKPGTESAVTDTVKDEDEKDSKDSKDSKAEETAKTTKAPATTQAPAAPATGKNYTTKGGAFLWFLLSVIVNTAISLAIANRFYKLTRRQNHVQAEIRALRRDLEEKFLGNVGGFAESNIDITNTNDDYSMEPDGIKMTPASTVSVDEEEGDVYKQWEEQFGARYNLNKESDEEDEVRVRKYQPQREGASSERMSVRERIAARRAKMEEEAVEAEEEDYEENGGISEKLSNVGNKAKELLGGIFPFGDDDDE